MNAPSQTLSIFSTFAASRHMEKEALIATLLKTIAPPEATMEDLVGFLQIAHRFDLDPWAKEIYLIKNKGRISTYISVDGYTRIVNREPAYDGCEFRYDQDEQGKITAVTCHMFRKDRSRPIVVTEFYDECVMPDSQAWRKSPGRMLRHRAFVQAARLAFGISGALDEGTDFAGPTIDVGPVSEPEQSPSPPKRRAPPAQGSAGEPRERKQAPPADEQRQEAPKAEQQAEVAPFDMEQFLETLSLCQTMEALKETYNDWDVDGTIGDDAKLLDQAQEAFLANQRRIERKG